MVWSWLIPPPLRTRDRAPKVSSTLGAVPVELSGIRAPRPRNRIFTRLALAGMVGGCSRTYSSPRGSSKRTCAVVPTGRWTACSTSRVRSAWKFLVRYGSHLSDHLRPHADLGVVRQVEDVGEHGVDRIGAGADPADLGQGLQAQRATAEMRALHRSGPLRPTASAEAQPTGGLERRCPFLPLRALRKVTGLVAHGWPPTRALTERSGPDDAPGGVGRLANRPLTPQSRSMVGIFVLGPVDREKKKAKEGVPAHRLGESLRVPCRIEPGPQCRSTGRVRVDGLARCCRGRPEAPRRPGPVAAVWRRRRRRRRQGW